MISQPIPARSVDSGDHWMPLTVRQVFNQLRQVIAGGVTVAQKSTFVVSCAPLIAGSNNPVKTSRLFKRFRFHFRLSEAILIFPSLLATHMAAVMSPVTFKVVRHMSSKRSTPNMTPIPSPGTPRIAAPAQSRAGSRRERPQSRSRLTLKPVQP